MLTLFSGGVSTPRFVEPKVSVWNLLDGNVSFRLRILS